MTKWRYQTLDIRPWQKWSIYNNRVKLTEWLDINPMNSFNVSTYTFKFQIVEVSLKNKSNLTSVYSRHLLLYFYISNVWHFKCLIHIQISGWLCSRHQKGTVLRLPKMGEEEWSEGMIDIKGKSQFVLKQLCNPEH